MQSPPTNVVQLRLFIRTFDDTIKSLKFQLSFAIKCKIVDKIFGEIFRGLYLWVGITIEGYTKSFFLKAGLH